MDPEPTEELEFFRDNFASVCGHLLLFRDYGSQNCFLLSEITSKCDNAGHSHVLSLGE